MMMKKKNIFMLLNHFKGNIPRKKDEKTLFFFKWNSLQFKTIDYCFVLESFWYRYPIRILSETIDTGAFESSHTYRYPKGMLSLTIDCYLRYFKSLSVLSMQNSIPSRRNRSSTWSTHLFSLRGECTRQYSLLVSQYPHASNLGHRSRQSLSVSASCHCSNWVLRFPLNIGWFIHRAGSFSSISSSSSSSWCGRARQL